jgi:outer membrane protein assembly factor BamD
MNSIVKRAWILLLLVVALTAGCKGGGVKQDPILRLSAEEALAEGKALTEKKKYTQASRFFDHAFEVAPNSATGREALLLAADAYYLDRGTANYVKAEAKYRDYLNRFPTSDRSDYVQLQIANCLAEQMRKPDRDQSATIKALTAFESVQQLYPTSDYAAEVESKIVEIRQNLAEHEYRVGRYNYRRRLYTAATWRLEGILEDFPEFNDMDKVLYLLGMSYYKGRNAAKSAEIFDQLRSEHPESKLIGKIPKRDPKPPRNQPPPAEADEDDTEEENSEEKSET